MHLYVYPAMAHAGRIFSCESFICTLIVLKFEEEAVQTEVRGSGREQTEDSEISALADL